MPGIAVPVSEPILKTTNEIVNIVSEIDFIIFKNSELTKIYASGAPVNLNSSVKANYEASIRHACWPLVKGKEESDLVQESYSFLKSRYN